MSRKSRANLTAVEKLIEQRRLFQEWLTKLDQGVDGMPGHVVERVRNDYRARLTEVTAELAEHGDAVRQALADAQARHDGLETRQTAGKDELAELRLRRHVGEVDDARFKEANTRFKATLEELGKELAASLRDIERYEEILDLIAEAPHPAAASAEAPEPAEAAAAPAAECATTPADEEEEEPEQEPAAAPPPAAPAKAPEPAPPEPAAARTPPPPRVSQIAADELEFLRAVTGAAAGAKAPGVPDEQPAARARAARPRTSDAPRSRGEGNTLICGECGAPNLPTEWYCEKCGAELSAI